MAYNDEKDGTQFGAGNSDANYIAVRHFDGTTAKYFIHERLALPAPTGMPA